MDLGFLQVHIPLFHSLTARGESNLDGFDIMVNYQNLDSEHEWNLHFQILTAELY